MQLTNTSFSSLLFVILFLVSCGGGVSGENGSDPFGSNTDNSIVLKLGHFNEQNQFIEGVIGITSSNNGISEMSAGGSIGLSVVVVDQDNQRIQTANDILFSSACVIAEKANLTAQVSSVNGQVDNTFVDQGCGGASGISDEIIASIITTNGITITATTELTIQPDAIGALRFVSAEPQSILLKGSGDVTQTQTTVTFMVVNDQGIALAQQTVNFSLTSEIGGVTLSDIQGISNDSGEVTVRLDAGDVPSNVRVNASVMSSTGEMLNTQSASIAITTGLPNQYSFSLAKDINNVEGLNRDGEEVNLVARLSDTFGNPVPDGTLINFTAEGGQIESSCATENGTCTVIWTSANPRPIDGDITILATAVGHETLFDSNGNNVYDQADGEAISDLSESGVFVSHPTGTIGFIDMSEAWRDDNNNQQWDGGEIFLDYNNNQQFDQADGLFNGTQCSHSELCGQDLAASIHVRKSVRLIAAGSEAYIDVNISPEVHLASNYQNPYSSLQVEIARGEKQEFSVLIADVNGNIMPANTEAQVASTVGIVEILTGTLVQNLFSRTPSKLVFTLENNLEEGAASQTADIKILVITPSGKESSLGFKALLQ